MWNLPLPDNETKTWYINALGKKTAGKLKSVDAGFKSAFNDVLLPGGKQDVINDLLMLAPKKSLLLCEKTMDKLLAKLHKGGYVPSELETYRKAKGKKDENRTDEEKKAFKKLNDVIGQLHRVFNYDEFISKDAEFSYELSKRKEARTCTYCGREYIFTVEDLSEDDKLKQIARPDFDHWLSHELYPMLALNYCNLIPSCPICNRIVKGTKLMEIGKHVHPYINNAEPKFCFSYKLLDINRPQGEVIIVNDKDPLEKATIEMFQLRAMYRFHSETELDDMLRIGLKNGKEYVEDYLMKIMAGLNISVADAYRSIFGAELYENISEERPLSKFKRDILSELGIMDLFVSRF